MKSHLRSKYFKYALNLILIPKPLASPRDNMVFHDTQNAKTGVPVVDSGIGGGGVCGTLYFSFEAAARSTGRNWWF